jgi:cell division protein FtsI/penicillin-binding protein 2
MKPSNSGSAKSSQRNMSRSLFLTVLVFLALAVLLIRLWFIQVVDHDEYLAKANQMQISKTTINPTRGQIYVRDQDGTLAPLVLNQTVYTLFADPTQVEDAAKIKTEVNKVAGGQVISGALDKLTDTKTQYVVLAKNLTRAQANAIHDADLAGLGLQSGTKRVYPEGDLAAQTLGFVNSDGVGQYGVEQYLNKQLSGTPGVLQSVTDVRHIPLTIGAHDVSVPAINGTDYVLSIDRSVQKEAENILKEGMDNVHSTSGSIIVMDPQNGHVLAMANYPSFDPADYGKVTDASAFQNAVVSYGFEPGSVMKTLTTATSLNMGKITPNTTYVNPGCDQVADAKICNASGDEYLIGRTLTMTDVLRYSLNTGVIWQLQNLGGGTINLTARNAIYDYFYNHFLLGHKTGIELPNESAGVIFAPTDVQGNNVRYANMVFGQGIDVTMLQMASAFSAAVNGGTYYKPTVIDGTVNQNGEEERTAPTITKSDVVSEQTSTELKNMMLTARRATYPTADNGYFVGSKTGTAQLYDPATGTYWDTEDKTIGTMLGFGADADGTARYVIMVRVNKDDKSSGFAVTTAANPVFTKMTNWLNTYEGLKK